MDLLGLLASGLAQTPMGGLLGTRALPYSPGASTSAPGAAVMAEPFTASGAAYPGGGQVPIAQPTPAPPGDIFSTTEAQYGLPAGYLARTAQIESGGNPSARNPNSSAAGLFQFIDSTAAAYGLENPLDPVASTDAAARLASDNAATLRRVLGREPTAAELYLAHQQGAGGAASLLANPNAPAASIVGADAVRLNGGSPDMTAGEFASLWLSKFDRQPQNVASPQFADNGGGSMSNASTGPTTDDLWAHRNDRGTPSGGLLSMPPAPERRPSIWDRAEGVPGLGLLSDPERRARLIIGLQGMTLNPNEGLIAMAQGDIEDGRQQEQRQRLAAWLGAQDNPTAQNLAAMMAAGLDGPAAGALLGAMQPPEPERPVIEGGMVFDPVTGALIADYRQQDPASAPETWQTLTPEEAAQLGLPEGGVYERSSRGNLGVVTPAPEGKGGPELSDVTGFQTSYRGEEAVKRMQAMGNAYGSLRVAAENNDPMAMVYAYVKMLDPTSVVRETETGMVASSTSIDQALLGQINGWLNGDPLPPQVQERIMRTAEGMYNDAAAAYAPVFDQYAGTAEFYGLPADQGPIDYRRAWEPIPPLASAPAAPAPAPAPAAASSSAPAPVAEPAQPPAGLPSIAPGEVPLMDRADIEAVLDAYEAAGQPIPPRLANLLRQRAQQLSGEANGG